MFLSVYLSVARSDGSVAVTVAHRISFPMPWIQTIIGWVEEGHRRMPVPVQ
jgi:hypothetical protein